MTHKKDNNSFKIEMILSISLLTTIIAFLSIFIPEINGKVSEMEKNALLKLYKRTGGESNWIMKWNHHDTDPCENPELWFGVFCILNDNNDHTIYSM